MSSLPTSPQPAPWKARVGLSLLAAASLALALGYYGQFSKLNWYDDEGYAMASVQHVLDGYRLYDDVVIFYGPVYNGVKGMLHGVLGWPLTHDNVRLTGLALLILSALFAGAAAGKESRSAVQAVATLLVMVLWLRGPFRREPGHPQELIALASCAVPLAAGWLSTRPRSAAAALGFLAAFAGLSKINVGALMVLGAGLGLSLIGVRAWPHRAGITGRFALGTAVLLAALAPVLLTLGRQPQPWLLVLVFFVEWGLVTTLIAAWRELPSASASEPDLGRPGVIALLVAFIFAGLLTVVVFSAPFIARGTTLPAMFDALVLSAARVTSSVDLPELSRRAEFGACMLVSAILLVVYVSHSGSSSRQNFHAWSINLGKLLIGAFCLTTGSLGRPLVGLMAVSFAWLAIPWHSKDSDADATPSDRQRIAISRTVVALVAVFQAMQMYPVAGSQRIIGGTLAIYLGVQILFDAIAWLSRRAPSTVAYGRRWALGPAAAALLPMAVTGVQLRQTAREYRAGRPLDLPGTSLLRLPVEQVAALEWLVDLVRDQSTTVIAAPGFNSLYFWSQKPPPTLDLVTITDDVLTPERQAAVAAAAAEVERPLVLTWRISRPGESRGPTGERAAPLEARLRREYRVAGVLLCPESVTDIELRVRPGSPSLHWLGCAVWRKDATDALTLEYDLTGVEAGVRRMQVVDAQTNEVLADSQSQDDRKLEISDAAGVPQAPPPRHGKLQFSPSQPVEAVALSVRLFDEGDRFISALPVVVVDQ